MQDKDLIIQDANDYLKENCDEVHSFGAQLLPQVQYHRLTYTFRNMPASTLINEIMEPIFKSENKLK